MRIRPQITMLKSRTAFPSSFMGASGSWLMRAPIKEMCDAVSGWLSKRHAASVRGPMASSATPPRGARSNFVRINCTPLLSHPAMNADLRDIGESPLPFPSPPSGTRLQTGGRAKTGRWGPDAPGARPTCFVLPLSWSSFWATSISSESPAFPNRGTTADTLQIQQFSRCKMSVKQYIPVYAGYTK